MTLRWLPNAITIARMVLAWPLLWLLAIDDYQHAFWLALVAGGSDFLDGWLAKRFDWRSALGGLLDPIADKLLLAVCFVGLWWSGHLPGWLTALVFGRDLLIVAGAWTWWRRIGPFKPAPSALGKASTFLQIALVLVVLLQLNGYWPAEPEAAIAGVLWLTALATVASGADYVGRWGLRAWRALRSKQ